MDNYQLMSAFSQVAFCSRYKKATIILGSATLICGIAWYIQQRKNYEISLVLENARAKYLSQYIEKGKLNIKIANQQDIISEQASEIERLHEIINSLQTNPKA